MTDTTTGTPLDRLAAFAREHAEAVKADHLARLTAARERECQQAEEHAARAYVTCFSATGQAPPPLEWTGYPRGRDTNSLRIWATAYLGQGLFLAYCPYHRRRRDGIGTFTLVAADHPDHTRGRETSTAHVPDLTSLAELLHPIQARRTGRAACPKETETR